MAKTFKPVKIDLGLKHPSKPVAKRPAVAKTKPTAQEKEIKDIQKSFLNKVELSAKNPNASTAAMNWFFNLVKGKLGRGRNALNPSEVFVKGDVFIGGMFFYGYDPKHKKTLPWYDTLPLVIPFGLYDDGFIGLNLHYLPPRMRAVLLNELIGLKKRAKSPDAYMKLSYRTLKSVSSSYLFEPCIHRYLSSHINTQLIKVLPDHWEMAALLPVQQFKKASDRKVWNSYKSSSIKGYKRKKK